MMSTEDGCELTIDQRYREQCHSNQKLVCSREMVKQRSNFLIGYARKMVVALVETVSEIDVLVQERKAIHYLNILSTSLLQVREIC